MRFGRMMSISMMVAAALLSLAATGCKREERRFREVPPAADQSTDVTQSDLQPGPSIVATATEHPYDDNAFALSNGKRLYVQMNCAGCHGLAGGGAIGPPLMDDKWIYGSDPSNIFATIVEGRPNGMPSWKGKLSNDQIWQLVAYVRDLSGLHRKDVRNSRGDNMAAVQDEQNRNRQTPRPSFEPPGSVTTP
ncbi:MAG: cytochrome c [Gemmatimonadaceae bacterium]|nr:cytochrome c [Gemmatimonadaceae bacterium]